MRKNVEKKKLEKEEEKKLLEQMSNLPTPPMLSDQQIEEMFGTETTKNSQIKTREKKKN